MKRNNQSLQAYRNDVDGKLKETLELVRDLIYKAAPKQEEIIEYEMLGYPGLANLAAQKN